MSYIVMARKYRPQTLDELVGQEHVARTLTNAIASGRIAHAYLFTGPRGVGKTTTARILAKAVDCVEGPTPSPCGKCDPCIEIAEGRSLDVIEIDGASNRGIDEMRDLRERVRYAPPGGRRKVYIIDEVHMLTTEAFNALLKTLEEPPPHVLFIFATTAPQKIPLTILSRCQRFDFRRIPVATIVERLAGIARSESLEVDSGVLERVARKADGSMRDAESLLDQVVAFGGEKAAEADVLRLLGVVEHDSLFSLGEHLLRRDLTRLLIDLDELTRMGWDLSTVVGGLIEHLRNLLVARIDRDATSLADFTPEEVDRYRASVEGISEEDLIRCLGMLTELEPGMKRSSQPRALAEVALLGFASRPAAGSLKDLVHRLESLEKKLGAAGDGDCGNSSAASTEGREENSAEIVTEEQEPEVEETGPPQRDLGLESIQEIWERVVTEVKSRKMSLGMFLAAGRPDGLDQGVLRVLFSDGEQYHAEQVMYRQNRDLVCQVLSKLAGRPVGIVCHSEEKKGPGAPGASESAHPGSGAGDLASAPGARKLMSAFDAEVVRVVNRPEKGR
ncbi:MAG: DNA polymerase III subunit gamma/tau [Candidatus Eisenbacteria sp.]|nr:DNA polymerase III subunit gamma/tau [Candidatus Eisenbacteria bacterium]